MSQVESGVLDFGKIYACPGAWDAVVTDVAWIQCKCKVYVSAVCMADSKYPFNRCWRANWNCVPQCLLEALGSNCLETKLLWIIEFSPSAKWFAGMCQVTGLYLWGSSAAVWRGNWVDDLDFWQFYVCGCFFNLIGDVQLAHGLIARSFDNKSSWVVFIR